MNSTITNYIEAEYWKKIRDYKDYEVSTYGRIKSNKRHKERILQPVLTCGYLAVMLYKNNVGRIYKLHRLVTTAFVENPNNKPCINHKNGVKTDNNVDNLEWCTQRENVLHCIRTGLRRSTKGIKRKYETIPTNKSK